MELRCKEKVVRLIEKGVDIPNPFTIDVGDEVGVDRISADGVRIYPGCRIYGAQTVIAGGSRLGAEGPVTIDDCQLGPKVELKGGFFTRSVFLEKANLGSWAHVREGCILEEEAGGAHCVGLKQTILFPFVTLGSLINFCDCLMAGGRSRKEHSEVGSSYIHFNFTPDGDKATASLFGDVPRGVMLNQPPIFLGGQGGVVGPFRMGYGNVVAANSVLRNDFVDENKLIVGRTRAGKAVDYRPRAYVGLDRIVGNNVLYIANLVALEEWYVHVRRPFFAAQELGPLVEAGALAVLAGAKKERVQRLKALAEKAGASAGGDARGAPAAAGRSELRERFPEIEELVAGGVRDGAVEELRDDFLAASAPTRGDGRGSYVAAIQALPAQVSGKGVAWLQAIVDAFCRRAMAILPSLPMPGR